MGGLELDFVGFELQFLGVRITRLLLGDEPVPRHLLQHVCLALLRANRNPIGGARQVGAGRIVFGRGLHQASDKGCLGNIEVACVLVEIAL